MARFTPVEQRIDNWAHRLLDGSPHRGIRASLVEFAVFVFKQAWATVFGAALLAVIVATRLGYPDDAALARNDFLVIAAVVIQALMLALRLETLRELRVILTFHVVGTVMELFKTGVGSWVYTGEGILHLGGVPLYSGFMYAAIGSYMVRVYRLFDLRFDRYPRRWITAILAVAIYANFFSHHYLPDARWLLFAAAIVVFGFCTMHFRVFRRTLRMPLLASFLGVALFIWFAENIGTWANAWQYPDQLDGWQVVSLAKLGSWFLLMIISVVLVAWVYPPRGLDPVGGSRQAGSMAAVEHFEIPVQDIARAQSFYKSALDFNYEPWADDMGMLLQPDDKGINGDLHTDGAISHPTVVFTVDDIEATIEKVVAAGGSQFGEIQPLGEMGRWVYINDSEGNVIGLFQNVAPAA